MVASIAAVLTILVLASYPFIAKLSGFNLSLLLNCVTFLKNVFQVRSIHYHWTISSAEQCCGQDQHQRGAANGISMTGMSLFRNLKGKAEVYAYHKSLPLPITSSKFGSIDPIFGRETDDDNG
ncbi:hypothetical protein IFM89_016063 [Coptis chinensis]|uniref:Uncharacterized protein n=1 Tax=Coptis chinensis TaxID=261450 RepID=A0A835LN35_9MAGN|nr:hypothetical protein IFM89_016063 [Coptis chinensis]